MQVLPVGGATLPERPVPGVVAITGGEVAVVLLPAHVNTLSQPDAASTAPTRDQIIRGRAHGTGAAITVAVMPCPPLQKGERWL